MLTYDDRLFSSKDIFFRSTPHPVTVTTRIITFLVGDPYKPSFVTVTGWGVDPIYFFILGVCNGPILSSFSAANQSSYLPAYLQLVIPSLKIGRNPQKHVQAVFQLSILRENPWVSGRVYLPIFNVPLLKRTFSKHNTSTLPGNQPCHTFTVSLRG